MEILFLGTSCAVPEAENGNSSFVVTAGENAILFEAGSDPFRGMLQARFDPMKVNILVISHYHADHITGFPGLLSTFSCLHRTRPLTVVAPRDTIDKLVSICRLLELYGEDLSFPVEYRDTYNHYGLELRLYPAHHTVPSAMVRCSYDSKSIFYSGDTDFHPDIAEHSMGCDVMIHDSTTTHEKASLLPGHSCPYEAGSSAEAAKVATLFLTHLCYDTFKSPQDAVVEARQSFRGRVILPSPMEKYFV